MTVWKIVTAALLLAAVTPGFSEDLEQTVKDLESRIEELEKTPAKEASAADFKTYWNDGVRVESADQAVKISMGGRLMYDVIWVDEDDEIAEELGDLENGSEFRRVRFYTSGTLYEAVDFKLQFDWAGSDTALKDAYVALPNLPVGRLQIGHFYEPYSLTALVSSKYNTFMERPPSVNAFSPIRNNGIMLTDAPCDERIHWALGAFMDADNQGSTTDEDLYAFTGRLVGTPVYLDDGARLVHFGASGGFRNLDGTVRYRSRPSIHKTAYFVDTQSTMMNEESGENETVDVDAEEAWIYGLESAAVVGPFHMQGELTGSSVERFESGEDYNPMGWYVQAGYFLTGEIRPYKKSIGQFVAVKPEKNFGQGGCGAWELAVRYSSVDLNDEDVEGGELDEVTLGLNWYLNKNTRIMLNYVLADLVDVGEAHFVGTRFQVYF